MIELYYSRYSINSEKVLLCLFEKELNFAGREIDLFRFEQTDDAYLAINPQGLVPTLIVDGAPVYESTAINEFIEDAYSEKPLRPSDPLECAKMRIWVQHFQDVFYPAMAQISQVGFIAEELKRRWSAAELERLIARKPNRDRAIRQLRAVRDGLTSEEISNAERNAYTMLDRMEQALAQSAWLCGTFSLADIAAAPNVHRFSLLGLGRVLEARPYVRDWYQRIQARAAFRRTYEFAPPLRNLSAALNLTADETESS